LFDDEFRALNLYLEARHLGLESGEVSVASGFKTARRSRVSESCPSSLSILLVTAVRSSRTSFQTFRYYSLEGVKTFTVLRISEETEASFRFRASRLRFTSSHSSAFHPLEPVFARRIISPRRLPEMITASASSNSAAAFMHLKVNIAPNLRKNSCRPVPSILNSCNLDYGL
jgi:hypothetical protein